MLQLFLSVSDLGCFFIDTLGYYLFKCGLKHLFFDICCVFVLVD